MKRGIVIQTIEMTAFDPASLQRVRNDQSTFRQGVDLVQSFLPVRKIICALILDAPDKEHSLWFIRWTIAAGCRGTEECRTAAILFINILDITDQAFRRPSAVGFDVKADLDAISLGGLQKQGDNLIFP